MVFGLIASAIYLIMHSNGDLQEQIFDMLFLGKIPYTNVTLPFGLWLIIALLITALILVDRLIASVTFRHYYENDYIAIKQEEARQEYAQSVERFDLIAL